MQSDLGRSIAARLKRVREKRQLSGREVGRQLGGISAAQVSKMENARQRIPCELLPAWCEVLNTTLAEVYGNDERHHFAQVPFSPRVARLYEKLPIQWQLHSQRAIESLYRLYRKDRNRS